MDLRGRRAELRRARRRRSRGGAVGRRARARAEEEAARGARARACARARARADEAAAARPGRGRGRRRGSLDRSKVLIHYTKQVSARRRGGGARASARREQHVGAVLHTYSRDPPPSDSAAFSQKPSPSHAGRERRVSQVPAPASAGADGSYPTAAFTTHLMEGAALRTWPRSHRSRRRHTLVAQASFSRRPCRRRQAPMARSRLRRSQHI